MRPVEQIAGMAAGQLTGQVGTLARATEKFSQVLANTVHDQLGQTAGSLAPARTLTPEALAEGGRYAAATGDVADLGHAISSAVSSRLERVRDSERQAAADVKTLLSGGDIELHNVILAAERAQLELQLTMQLRNKLLEAYQEIMRLAV